MRKQHQYTGEYARTTLLGFAPVPPCLNVPCPIQRTHKHTKSAVRFINLLLRIRQRLISYQGDHMAATVRPPCQYSSLPIHLLVSAKDYPCSCLCIAAAARRPSPMARITVAPPRTISPPA